MGFLTLAEKAWYFLWCLVHWEVVTDRTDQQPALHWDAEQMGLSPSPAALRALLPLTITRDRGTDAQQEAWPQCRSSFCTPLIQCSLPCNLPCIAICAFTQSTFIMSPGPALAVCHIYWLPWNCSLRRSLSKVPRKSHSPSDRLAASWWGPEAITSVWWKPPWLETALCHFRDKNAKVPLGLDAASDNRISPKLGSMLYWTSCLPWITRTAHRKRTKAVDNTALFLCNRQKSCK